MNNSQFSDSTACVYNCERVYRDCLLRGDEEVFCRIQRAPCDSNCSELSMHHG